MASEIGALGNLAAERAAAQQVRREEVRPPQPSPPVEEARAEGPDAARSGEPDAVRPEKSDSVRLSEVAEGELSTAPKDGADKFRSDEKVPLEGYNQEKLDNPDHQTPKYLFGRVAQNYKLDSVQGDKAKAEELLKAMVPDLQAAGLEIAGVQGDRIQVKTELGYEWVDVIRGAGSDNPGWWWGSEGQGTPQPTESPAAAAAAAPAAPVSLGSAPLEGFNHEKLLNPAHTTPKYLFGRVASHYDVGSVKNKQQAEALLEQMIQDLQAQGLYVVGVDGDKIQVQTELGFEWVDVIRGAGSGSPAFQWLSSGRGTPYPTVFPPH